MPYTPDEAVHHDKDANTPAKQEKWSHIANSVWKQTGDPKRAIRIASSAVGPQHGSK